MTSRARPSPSHRSSRATVVLHAALLAAACKPEAAKVASPVTAAPEPDSASTPPKPINSSDATPASNPSARPDPTAAPAAPGAPPASASRRAPSAAADARGHRLAPTELLTGSEHGLLAYSFDGKRRRTISRGAALHPRWLDAEHVIVLSPRDPQTLSAGAVLQRISLTDGRRHDLAVLLPFTCQKRPPEIEDFAPYQLDLQDGKDFELAPAEERLCLQLLDRNVNMASVVLDVRIDLRTRRVERWLSVGDDVCTPPRGVHLGSPPNPCSGQTPEVATPAQSYAYDMPDADGRVIQTSASGTRPALQLGLDYSPESYSPSGRWRVLGGDTEEGDYLYRRLSLLDRESGHVYPIIPGKPWPAALEPRPGSPPTLPPIERAVLVPGEADVRWLELADAELLVVDNAIVRPGVGSFEVDGAIAR